MPVKSELTLQPYSQPSCAFLECFLSSLEDFTDQLSYWRALEAFSKVTYSRKFSRPVAYVSNFGFAKTIFTISVKNATTWGGSTGAFPG